LQQVSDDRWEAGAAPTEVNQLWMSSTTTILADR
jgi:hypothetical protein